MVRHMMRQDMRRSDMVQDHAAVSYYAGNRSYFGGFFWYAYFGGADRYRLTGHTRIDLLTRVGQRLRRSDGAAFLL